MSNQSDNPHLSWALRRKSIVNKLENQHQRVDHKIPQGLFVEPEDWRDQARLEHEMLARRMRTTLMADRNSISDADPKRGEDLDEAATRQKDLDSHLSINFMNFMESQPEILAKVNHPAEGEVSNIGKLFFALKNVMHAEQEKDATPEGEMASSNFVSATAQLQLAAAAFDLPATTEANLKVHLRTLARDTINGLPHVRTLPEFEEPFPEDLAVRRREGKPFHDDDEIDFTRDEVRRQIARDKLLIDTREDQVLSFEEKRRMQEQKSLENHLHRSFVATVMALPEVVAAASHSAEGELSNLGDLYLAQRSLMRGMQYQNALAGVGVDTGEQGKFKEDAQDLLPKFRAAVEALGLSPASAAQLRRELGSGAEKLLSQPLSQHI